MFLKKTRGEVTTVFQGDFIDDFIPWPNHVFVAIGPPKDSDPWGTLSFYLSPSQVEDLRVALGEYKDVNKGIHNGELPSVQVLSN